MTDEYTQVPVHGRHLRYANAQLTGAGIPFAVQPGAGGIYIIVIPAGYAPAVAGAPWVHQPVPAAWARGIPFVQVAIAALILVLAWVVFQAGPVAVAMLAGDAPTVQEASSESAETSELAAALDTVLAIPDRISSEVDRRVEEAQQETQAAIFSTLMVGCGTPLLIGLVALAGFFVLRMVLRSRR